MKVNEFAKKIGIASSKVRYYDRMGLIQGERKENNYRDFNNMDALSVYHAQMLRSFDMSVQETLDAKQESLKGIDYWVSDHIDNLEEMIRHEQIRLFRLKEMKQYFNAIQNEWGIISFYDRPESINLCHLGKENIAEEWIDETVEQLSEVMPFSYIAIKVKKESFFNESDFLDVRIGLGILERNRKLLKLELPEEIEKTKGGKIVQQYIEAENPFELTKTDLKPLLDFLEENHIEIKEDMVGRIYISYMKNDAFVHGIVLAYPFEK